MSYYVVMMFLHLIVFLSWLIIMGHYIFFNLLRKMHKIGIKDVGQFNKRIPFKDIK